MTTYEWSARLCLRAYPPRWRTVYGADLLGTLQDVAEPGARVVGVRDGISVVAAGWSLRWRERPPVLTWLGYRLFERRMPASYRQWVVDDLLGRFYSVRAMGVAVVVFAGVLSLVSLAFPGVRSFFPTDPILLAGLLGGPVVMQVLFGFRYWQRKAWRRHVSGWVPPELRPRRQRSDAARELAEFRASTGYESVPHSIREA